MIFKKPYSTGGGGGAESAHADFNFRETSFIFKQYLPNVATFTKIYWENKILEKFCVKGITCCHGNRVFDTMFTQILTF